MFANVEGQESIFSMGRDVNLFHDVKRDRWQATYTGGWPGGKGHAMVCRTAPKLAGPWSDPPSDVRTPEGIRRLIWFRLPQQTICGIFNSDLHLT